MINELWKNVLIQSDEKRHCLKGLAPSLRGRVQIGIERELIIYDHQ